MLSIATDHYYIADKSFVVLRKYDELEDEVVSRNNLIRKRVWLKNGVAKKLLN